ncbi:MAG: tetratricopeptide repeat protein [Candidatus Heimdallarchaeota archaeon]|nr:tetratricopeptide repeat protein [Candidatus Heimdallarchaeota archaeon]
MFKFCNCVVLVYLWGIFLPSIPKNKFDEFDQFIIHGEFKEAQNLILKLEKTKNISIDDKLRCWVLKSENLNQIGEHEQALQQIDLILKEAKIQEFPLIHLDTLLQQSIAHWRLGDFEKSSITNRNCNEIINTIPKEPIEVFAKRKSLYQANVGVIHSIRGEYDKTEEFYHKAHLTAKKSKNKQIISYMISVDGFINLLKGDYEKAEEYFKQGLKIAKEIGNKQEIARSYHYYGILYNYKNERKKSIDFFEKSLFFAENSESKRDLHLILGDAGVAYLNLFKLDEALRFLEKSLTIREKHAFVHNDYNFIGYIYHLKNEPAKAIEYYKKSLEICEKIGDKRRIFPRILFNLITASIAVDDLDQAQMYVEYLHRLSTEEKEKIIEIYYKLSSALVLKTKTRVRYWIEAEQILEELIADKILDSNLNVLAMFNLAELLFKEFQLTGDSEVLSELDKTINNLHIYASKEHYNNLVLNTIRLQAQIALIELQPEKAFSLLNHALIYAKDKGLVNLIEEITEEQQKLKNQMTNWKNLQKQEPSVSEVIKQAKLENGLRNFAKETVLEVKDEKTGEIIEYRKLFALKL